MKDKIMGVMEKFSKAMVQPLSYISVAGMILVIGVLLTNTTIDQLMTSLVRMLQHLLRCLYLR